MLHACSVCGALNKTRRCPEHGGNVTDRNGSTREWRKTRERILKRDGYRCTELLGAGLRCPITHDLHVDHRIPRSQGGSDEDDNLATRCSMHNLRKGDRTD